MARTTATEVDPKIGELEAKIAELQTEITAWELRAKNDALRIEQALSGGTADKMEAVWTEQDQDGNTIKKAGTQLQSFTREPWRYREEIDFHADTGYEQTVMLGRLKSALERAFVDVKTGETRLGSLQPFEHRGTRGKRQSYDNLPRFSQSNRLCVTVEILPPE